MGNYRFRVSAMMPNAWFYKLRDMNKPRNHLRIPHPTPRIITSSSSNDLSNIANQPHLSDQRKSYYITRPNSPTNTPVPDRQFPTEPPRRSARRIRRRRRTTRKTRPPPRRVSTDLDPDDSMDTPLIQTSSPDHDSLIPEYGSDRTLTTDAAFDDAMLLPANSCNCRMQNDDDINNHRLPQIITTKQEPTRIHRTSAVFSETNAYGSLSVKVVQEEVLSGTRTDDTSPVRRLPAVKLRMRIGNRQIQSGRRSVSNPPATRSVSGESLAVVKSSRDPRKDFRESMVEMIVENNIRTSEDLEELLACYLSLNSDEYHELIINVFKQIWVDYFHVRLN